MKSSFVKITPDSIAYLELKTKAENTIKNTEQAWQEQKTEYLEQNRKRAGDKRGFFSRHEQDETDEEMKDRLYNNSDFATYYEYQNKVLAPTYGIYWVNLSKAILNAISQKLEINLTIKDYHGMFGV